MLILQLKINLTRTEIPHPFQKYWPKYKSSFDHFLSYHRSQLTFFITNYGLNGHVYILKIVLDILHELIHDSQNACGYLTLDEMYM